MSYDWAPIRAEGTGSGVNKTDPYRYPHLNSIYKYGDDYLLSSRYICSVFFITHNGSVILHLHVSIFESNRYTRGIAYTDQNK